MSPRAVLLAVSSVTGLLLAGGLDGLGLLPGVAESDAVRRAALDPRTTAVAVLLCLAVTTVLLVLRLDLAPVVDSVSGRPVGRPRLPAYRVVVCRQVGGGAWGRAPPRWC